MKTSHRNYEAESGDFNRICHFFIAHAAHLRCHSTWCLARFADWPFGPIGGKLPTPEFVAQNAHLWFDGFDMLAGLAISETGRSEVVILTPPGYRFLFAEILRWIVDNWGALRPELSIEISATQEKEAAVLEDHGFSRAASFYTFHYDLQAGLAEPVPLEPGFTLVDMQARPDYRAQRILRYNAFRGPDELSEEELDRLVALYSHGRQSPIYHAPTDVCVVAPDGAFVAGCEALIDAHNAEADVERVCSHSRYRRRGLARAAILECFHRLRDMGLEKAYISGYSPEAIGLYGSLGAREQSERLIYKRGETGS
jgi:ribosomal protein S18 acetylase RimI-like enzyme